MARKLVWMCGGLVAVGALFHLIGAWSSGGMEQSPAAADRPPSTPASAVPQDPVAGIETTLRKQLLKDSVLTPPSAAAPLPEQKAYDYALEAKNGGADDLTAVRAAAERIWTEIKAEREARSQARQADAKEGARLRQEMKREKIDRRRAERPEPPGVREMLPPRAPKPDLGPAFIEDPENPLRPKPTKP